MTTLIFFITFLTLLVLIIRAFIKAIKCKPIIPVIKKVVFLLGGYFIVWLLFYFFASPVVVPLTKDVCFDDWCATVTKIEKGVAVQGQLPVAGKDSMWIILDITMSNHARGIAQKPSEPRIHIIDDKGLVWEFSGKGQKALEKLAGKQIALDQRLQLGQSLQTKLVYAIPSTATGLKVLIEEGPFITKLLFPTDYSVFGIH